MAAAADSVTASPTKEDGPAAAAAPAAALVIFARLPVPGRAKTRLAAGVGPEAAAGFYKACAERTFQEALRCPHVAPQVHCSSAHEAPLVAAWLQTCGCGAVPVVPQIDDSDLGVRMLAALCAAASGTALGPPLGRLEGQRGAQHEERRQQQLEDQQHLEQQQQQHQEEQLEQQQLEHLHLQQQQQQQEDHHQHLEDLQDQQQQDQLKDDDDDHHQQQQQQQQDNQQRGGARPASADLAPPDPDPDPARMCPPAAPGTSAPAPRPAIVVGTDIPDLDAAVLSAAAAALESHDVVIGPAADGGYYLMGLSAALLSTPQGEEQQQRRNARAAADLEQPAGPAAPTTAAAAAAAELCRVRGAALFRGIPWSTPCVLAATMRAAAAAGLRVAPEGTLPVLLDVDTLDDVREWVEQRQRMQTQTQQQTQPGQGRPRGQAREQPHEQERALEPRRAVHVQEKGGQQEEQGHPLLPLAWQLLARPAAAAPASRA